MLKLRSDEETKSLQTQLFLISLATYGLAFATLSTVFFSAYGMPTMGALRYIAITAFVPMTFVTTYFHGVFFGRHELAGSAPLLLVALLVVAIGVLPSLESVSIGGIGSSYRIAVYAALGIAATIELTLLKKDGPMDSPFRRALDFGCATVLLALNVWLLLIGPIPSTKTVTFDGYDSVFCIDRSEGERFLAREMCFDTLERCDDLRQKRVEFLDGREEFSPCKETTEPGLFCALDDPTDTLICGPTLRFCHAYVQHHAQDRNTWMSCSPTQFP